MTISASSAGSAGLAELINRGAAALAQPVGDQPLAQLVGYLQLLDKWHRVHNLVAAADPADMVPRHLLDSLAVLPWVAGRRLLDVGSGAGLPGVPIAIARPQLQVVLLDSRRKRIAFLRQVVAELALANVTVFAGRVEQYRPTEKFDTLTARGFAVLPEIVTATRHLCHSNSRILALKGVYPGDEIQGLADTGFTVAATHRLQVPGLQAQRHVVVMEPKRRQHGVGNC